MTDSDAARLLRVAKQVKILEETPNTVLDRATCLEWAEALKWCARQVHECSGRIEAERKLRQRLPAGVVFLRAQEEREKK